MLNGGGVLGRVDADNLHEVFETWGMTENSNRSFPAFSQGTWTALVSGFAIRGPWHCQRAFRFSVHFKKLSSGPKGQTNMITEQAHC